MIKIPSMRLSWSYQRYSSMLIQSEGTCYEHFLYSLDAVILSAVVHTILYTPDVLLTSPRTDVHLSTASYPWSHTFGAVRPIWAGTIFIESTNWESTNREHTHTELTQIQDGRYTAVDLTSPRLFTPYRSFTAWHIPEAVHNRYVHAGSLYARQNQLSCRRRSKIASIKAVVGVLLDSFVVSKYIMIQTL